MKTFISHGKLKFYVILIPKKLPPIDQNIRLQSQQTGFWTSGLSEILKSSISTNRNYVAGTHMTT